MKVLLRNTVDLNAFTDAVGSSTPYKSTRTSLNFLISVVFYKPYFWISILLSPILILVSDQWSTVATRCMWSGYFCRLCLALRSSASPCLKRLWTAVPCEPQCSTWSYQKGWKISRGFVSGYEAGLLHQHDSHPKSKESQIRALEKGCHQHSSPSPI